MRTYRALLTDRARPCLDPADRPCSALPDMGTGIAHLFVVEAIMRRFSVAPLLVVSLFALAGCTSEPEGDEGDTTSQALDAVATKYVGDFEGVGEPDAKGPKGQRIFTRLTLSKGGDYMGGRHPWNYGRWSVATANTPHLYLSGMDSNPSAHYPIALSPDGRTLTLTDGVSGHREVFSRVPAAGSVGGGPR
ncbi:MAG: hypothetical protein ACXWUE_42320 [Polyangiales bacterium]